MDELDARLIACQILIAGLIARVAGDQRDPVAFLSDFRDEIRAVIGGIDIAGLPDAARVRILAQRAADELFGLMKPPPEN